MLINSLFLLLISIAVTSRRDKSILYSRISIIILLFASYIALDTLELNAFSNGIGLFGGLFHMSAITNIFQVFIFLLTAVILQLTGFNPRKLWQFSEIKGLFLNKTPFARVYHWAKNNISKPGEQQKIIEYPLIILFIIIGASFLISSSDIVSIFLSIELQSYGLYLLCSLNRNSELSTSAGLTYFLLGGFSSCFILLGTALLYVNSGTTNLDNFYVINNLYDLVNDNDIYKINYIHFSLLIMSIGFLFKISAAPFHFWSPDVYDAIPTITTTFVAIVAKVSILVFLLEIIHYTNNVNSSYNWTIILLFSSFLSLIIGTVLGLNQFRIKRLLAYSTISHLGFILLALTVNTIESIQAFMFYLMQYSISNLNIFVILITIGYTLYYYVDKVNSVNNNLQDRNNSPIQLISQLKGYFYINPMLAISFIITIYSLVGIPPLIGFFAKQVVLSSALDNGYIFISMVAILTSVISAVYYLTLVKQIFFFNSDYVANTELNYPYKGQDNIRKYTMNHILISSTLSITISILTLVTLLFILNPQEWLSITNILAIIMFNL